MELERWRLGTWSAWRIDGCGFDFGAVWTKSKMAQTSPKLHHQPIPSKQCVPMAMATRPSDQTHRSHPPHRPPARPFGQTDRPSDGPSNPALPPTNENLVGVESGRKTRLDYTENSTWMPGLAFLRSSFSSRASALSQLLYTSRSCSKRGSTSALVHSALTS